MMTVCRRGLRLGLMLLTLFFLSGCVLLDNSKLFLPPSWAGLDTLNEEVRVDHAATQEQRAQILRMQDEARARMTDVVGQVRSHPVLVFCVTAACYQGFGGGTSPAKALMTFGASRILIGPDGMTTAYLAHEWWHAELHHRLGYWGHRKVPTWFDEGVAVWVSQDSRYGEEMYQRVIEQGIVPPSLKEMETLDGWNAAVKRYGDYLWASKPADAVTVVYPTAAREVRRWMNWVGIEGLHALVDGLERGQDFQSLYESLERQAQQAKRAEPAA